MIIIYSNYIKFNNRILSYRKKVLFDITETPKALFCICNKGFFGYWIGSEWLNENQIPTMVNKRPVNKDVSNIELYLQKQLDKVI